MSALAIAAPGWAQSATPAPTPTPLPAPSGDPGEPIIGDSQFEAELPSLDPALGTPLEPLDQFQGPPAAPGETVPDAPVPDDPALTEPLPPLATFDVTTPERTGEPEEAPPVRYTLTVEGLQEIELAGRFRELSALEDGDGEATNGTQIASRVREDEQLLVRLLRSDGYYDGVGTITVAQATEPGGVVQVTVTAAPGDRYKFGTIAVQGPETVPPGLPREALGLKAGDPIVAAVVTAAEANVSLRLTQQGYPFPEVGQRDVLLDPETDLGDYTLPVEPGPRARFGGFTTEGDLAFDARHVEVLSRFKRGDLYDSRLVDDLREAMVATNLFTSVSAAPARTGEAAPDGTEFVNINVVQDAGPPRSLTASGGFSTGEGLRLEAGWEHRNLFPPEGAVRAAAVAGTSEQSVNLSFRRSNAGKRDRTVLVEAEAGRRDYDAFRGYTARLAGLISRESTPIWQKVWTWAYGAEIIATNERQFRVRNAPDPKATYFIAGLTGQLGYDRSDNLLNPTRGFRLLGRTNPEVSLQNGANPYIRNQIDGSVYVPAGDSLVVAARARFGSIFGAERKALAPSRRFYAGGGGSVRGFGFQDLGPKVEVANPNFDPEDPDEKANPTILVPVGGRSLTEFSLEGRYRFGDYGIVAFIDAGQVTSSETPGFGDLRYGIGVGGRLYTNFGPLRVDVATPLGRRRGEPIVAVYVSIGQAF